MEICHKYQLDLTADLIGPLGRLPFETNPNRLCQLPCTISPRPFATSLNVKVAGNLWSPETCWDLRLEIPVKAIDTCQVLNSNIEIVSWTMVARLSENICSKSVFYFWNMGEETSSGLTVQTIKQLYHPKQHTQLSPLKTNISPENW